MRKKFLLLLICSMFVFIGSVNAANGPQPQAEGGSTIAFQEAAKFIYTSDTSEEITEYEGISYDIDTNTLTLNNAKYDDILLIGSMGEDFKLKLIGENEILTLAYASYGYKSSLYIIGDGSLIINKNKDESVESPIMLHDVNVVFGKDVTIKAYSAPEEAFDPGDIRYTLQNISSSRSSIVFEGNNGPEITSKRKDGHSDEIKGVMIEHSDKTYKVVESSVNGTRRAMYEEGGHYFVSSPNSSNFANGLLIKDSNTGKWYIDFSYDGEYYLEYDSLESLNNSTLSIVSDETIQPDFITFYNNKLSIRLDADNNKYAIDEDLPAGPIYNVTDQIVDMRGVECKVLTLNTTGITEDELYYEYYEYEHYTYGDAFILEPKKEESSVVSNPKTGDNIISYVILAVLSLLALISKKSTKKGI